MYGAFDSDKDQVLRFGSVVEVPPLLESGRSVLSGLIRTAIFKQVKTEAESILTEAP